MTPPDEEAAGAEPRPAPEGDAAQLEWEARAGRPAAAAAFAGALLPIIGIIVFASSVSGAGEGDAGLLVAIDEGSAGVIAAALVRAVGILVFPVALFYLYRVTVARRPETPGIALPLLVAASVGVAIALVLQEIFRLDVASDFAAAADQSEEAADAAVEGSTAETFGLVQLGLRVPYGIALILIALNAMRAGLLGRFMGIIGVGVGIFYAVPILLDPTLIQLFWGVALGFLFVGRWPGGQRGPAWERVEAVPWPTAADRMEAQRQARVDQAQSESGAGAAEPAADESAPRPASRKRRRGR